MVDVKAAKAAATTERGKALSKGQKTWKILKMIYTGVRFADSGLGASKDLWETLTDEEYDWSNPNDIALGNRYFPAVYWYGRKRKRHV